MPGNLIWNWAYWSYLAQEFSWCRVGFTVYLAVGGSWFSTYLASLFPSSREKISQSDRQPLHSKMGTSPLSLGTFGNLSFFWWNTLEIECDYLKPIRQVKYWSKPWWPFIEFCRTNDVLIVSLVMSIILKKKIKKSSNKDT